MIKKISPSHLPKGTVFKTSLYAVKDNGEIEQHYKNKQLSNAAVFVVDHVVAVDGWGARNYIVVTTTPKTNPLYEGDDYYQFNIGHITEIISLGHKTNIRYTEVYNPEYFKNKSRSICYDFTIRLLITATFAKLQPQNKFNIVAACNGAVKAGVFIGVPENKLNFRVKGENVELTPLEKFITFRINPKKLKKWAKQNVNRYIMSNAEIKKQEEKAVHDGFYGGST